MVGKTRSGRNQAAHDDVFFQATQLVALAHDGRFGQHAGGFLEGSRRDERIGGQRRLGDPQQQVGVGGRDFAIGAQSVVGVEHFAALHLLACDVAGVSWVFHHHATQHLAHDHFNVLVVDLHALQAVYVLHFVHDVAGQFFDAQQTQDVLRIGWAVHNAFALVHHLAFVHQNALLFGHQFFVHATFRVGDLQAHFALGFLAERDGTGTFSQHALVFGTAGFEQLGHARQTTHDIAGFLTFDRDTGQHFARADFLTVAHLNQRTHLEADRHRMIGTGNFDFLT